MNELVVRENIKIEDMDLILCIQSQAEAYSLSMEML